MLILIMLFSEGQVSERILFLLSRNAGEKRVLCFYVLFLLFSFLFIYLFIYLDFWFVLEG
jgi:hypothetical protein